MYFNPRSSCEERLNLEKRILIQYYFNPRSSCEERLKHPTINIVIVINFNPRSSCEERPNITEARQDTPKISIHALRVKSVVVTQAMLQGVLDISIHALRVKSVFSPFVPISQSTISIHALRVKSVGCR